MSDGIRKESKRLRFTSDDDLALLREFIWQKPLEEPEKWGIVQKNVFDISGKKFSIRTLKDHLFLILETWLLKDTDFSKRSGFEEIYSERDQLLQEVSDICNSSNISPRKKKKTESKEKQIADLGRIVREQCDNIQLKHEISTSTSNSQSNYLDHDNFGGLNKDKIELVVETEIRPDMSSHIPIVETTQVNNESESNRRNFGVLKARKTALEYLQSKEEKQRLYKEKELELQEKRLQLEERKITLQEKQFEMEVLERREKLEIEKEKNKEELFERNQSAKLIENQRHLIQTLMTMLKKKYEDC